MLPLLLILIYKFARSKINPIIGSILTLSLVLAHWASNQFPDASFFLLPSRIWELFSGLALAKLQLDYGRKPGASKLSNVFPSLGLLMIIYSVLFFDDKITHPSLLTVIPILGTCLIIWYSGANDIVTKFLSLPMVVGIGLISYSFYLTHVPIFVFYRLGTVTDSNFEKLLLIVLSMVLSFIIWFAIEQPFRDRARIGIKNFTLIIGLILCLLIGFASYITTSAGGANRLGDFAFAPGYDTPWSLLKQANKDCYERNTKNACFFKTEADSDLNIVMLGDSHVGVLSYPMWEKLSQEQGSLLDLTVGACPYVPGFERRQEGKILQKCAAPVNIARRKRLLSMPPSIVVTGGKFTYVYTGKYFDNQEGGDEGDRGNIMALAGKNLPEEQRVELVAKVFSQAIQELLDHGHKIVLIYPVPNVGWDLPEEFLKLVPKSKVARDAWVKRGGITTSYDVHKEFHAATHALYDSLGNDDSILRIYPDKFFCNTVIEGRCITHDDKELFYVDSSHVAVTIGRKIVNEIITEAKSKWKID